MAKVPGGFGEMPRVQQQMVPLDFEPPEPAPPAAAQPVAANDDGEPAEPVTIGRRRKDRFGAASFEPGNRPCPRYLIARFCAPLPKSS